MSGSAACCGAFRHAATADDEADARFGEDETGDDPGSGSGGPSQARKNNAIGEVLGKLFSGWGNYDGEYLARPRVP